MLFGTAGDMLIAGWSREGGLDLGVGSGDPGYQPLIEGHGSDSPQCEVHGPADSGVPDPAPHVSHPWSVWRKEYPDPTRVPVGHGCGDATEAKMLAGLSSAVHFATTPGGFPTPWTIWSSHIRNHRDRS